MCVCVGDGVSVECYYILVRSNQSSVTSALILACFGLF